MHLLTIRVPDETYESLRDYAFRDRTSINAIVNRELDWFAQNPITLVPPEEMEHDQANARASLTHATEGRDA